MKLIAWAGAKAVAEPPYQHGFSDDEAWEEFLKDFLLRSAVIQLGLF